jgi:hypothetical protein
MRNMGKSIAYRLLCRLDDFLYRAKVVIGDINVKAAEAVVQEIVTSGGLVSVPICFVRYNHGL